MSTVCVYCASSTRIEPAYVALARELGAELAGHGHALVTGGGKVSMMGAVASAARGAGGRTTGVIPRALLDTEIGDTDSDDLVVVTTMRERKAEMERRSDAFLALPGGIGTFEELFEVWTSRSLHMHDKPVIALDPDGFYDPLWDYLRALVARHFVRPEAFEALQVARTVSEALALIP